MRSSRKRNRDMVGQSLASSEAHEFPALGILQSKTHYPWLVYRQREEDAEFQAFCDINSSSGDVIFKQISELVNHAVLYCSPDGKKVILRRLSTRLQWQGFVLWGPEEDEAIALPVLAPHLQSRVIHDGLFYDSSSPMVLLFVEQTPVILYYCLDDRDGNWKEFNYAQSIVAQTGYPLKPQYFLCSPVNFNGTIYATASGYTDLVQITIDYDKNSCETRLLMPHKDPAGYLQQRSRQCFVSRKYVRIYLVNLGDHDLYLISVYPRSIDRYGEALSVSILKFDFSSNTWQQRTSLDGGAVFLCPDYALSSDMAGGGEYSYIYFAFENNQTLFSYR